MSLLQYSMVTSLSAQYRAQSTPIDEPVYHLYSSDLYPCLALTNTHLYKVFGTTVVKYDLPTHLNLSGEEYTILIPGDKEILIANPDEGATVINFADAKTIKMSQSWDQIQLSTINFDENTYYLYSNPDGVYRKRFHQPPHRILKDEHIITSSAPTDRKGNFIFADLNTGIYGTYGDSIANIFAERGVTAVDFIDQTIYMNHGGSIKKLSKKGGMRTLTTLPDKHKSASDLYYDNDYNIWILGEDLFAYNLTDGKLYDVEFDRKDVVIFDAITRFGVTYIATSQGLFTFQRTLDRIIHRKGQHGLPLIYASGSDNILIDSGDLYTLAPTQSQRLSTHTHVKYPIKGRDDWWIRLDDKLLKVNDRSTPPLQSPSDTVTAISQIDQTTYAIGTTEGIYVQNSQEANPRLHILRDTAVNDLLPAGHNTLLSGSQHGMHSAELVDGKSRLLDSERTCPAQSLHLHRKDTIAVCREAIHIIGIDSTMVINAVDDLNLNSILDIELINDDLYILGNNQLLKGDYREITEGNVPAFTRYRTFDNDRGLVTYQNGQFFIETATNVSIVSPSKLATHQIEPEVEPSFTYEYIENSLMIYDQKSSAQSAMKYETADGEWEMVADNTIPYSSLSDEGLKVQKKNLYGDWIPLKVKPVTMHTPPKQSKLGWIFISLGLISLLLLLKTRLLRD